MDKPVTKAMLLAAGLGTRLRPLTADMPKCMIPVGGKPVLEHAIVVLRRHGVTELLINLLSLPEVVTSYFGDGSKWGVKITYSFESEPLGTAGGVKKVSAFFDRPFFVWYADNLSMCDLRRLHDFHRAKGGLATIAVHYRADPCASGIVGLDAHGRITGFLEKPRPDQIFSHWVNAGVYVLEPALLDAIPSTGTPDFGRDIFPSLLRQGAPLFGYCMTASEGLWWIDTPEDLRRVQAAFPNGFNSHTL